MKRFVIYLMSFIIVIMSFINISYAASIGTSGDTVTADAGSTVVVRFSTSGINANNPISAVEASVGTLPSGITLKGMSSSVGGASNGSVSWTSEGGYAENVVISLTLELSDEIDAGSYTIPFSFSVLEDSEGNNYAHTVSSTVKVIEKPQETPETPVTPVATPTPNINAGDNNGNTDNNTGNTGDNNENNTGNSGEEEQKKSNDADIKNINAESDGKNIALESSSTRYSATIDADINSVTFTIETNSELAKIDSEAVTTGLGFKRDSEEKGKKTYTVSNLKEGNNVISISVIAEDGTTKEYKLVLTRKVAEDKNDVVVPNIDDGSSKDRDKDKNNKDEADDLVLNGDYVLKSLKIIDVEISPSFNPNTYYYTATVEGKDSVEIVAVPLGENATVEIIGNNNLALGENLITIFVRSDDGVATYQILLTRKEPLKIAGISDNGLILIGVTFGWKQISIICIAGVILGIMVLYIANMSRTVVEEDDDPNNNKKNKFRNNVYRESSLGFKEDEQEKKIEQRLQEYAEDAEESGKSSEPKKESGFKYGLDHELGYGKNKDIENKYDDEEEKEAWLKDNFGVRSSGSENNTTNRYNDKENKSNSSNSDNGGIFSDKFDVYKMKFDDEDDKNKR